MRETERSAERIGTLIRARYPLIYVVSYEERRVTESLREITSGRKKELFGWSITEGLKMPDNSFITDLKDPVKVLEYIDQSVANGVFILYDYHPYLTDPVVVRKLRDVSHRLKSTMKSIIMLSPVLKTPLELEKELAVVDYELPRKEEIAAIVERIGESLKVARADGGYDKVVEAALGLTAEEAENVFAKSLVRRGTFDAAIVLSEKEQIIRKSGVLEYYHTAEQIEDVGGLSELKRWLEKRGKAFSEAARVFGLPEPRGILLLGIPGCGKSLIAKAISALWELPLLRLDVGKVFSSFVGSSEENTRRAIQTAESIAPCILWLDEIEKGFAGTGASGMTDGGTTSRVFGTFLTWLQEKRTPVFVVATSNDVSKLPPELLRKGRFDEIFYVDLPAKQERAAIFAIHLSKRGRAASLFNIEELAAQTAGFSGAEIEEVVVSALYDAFDEGVELKQEHLAENARSLIPLSTTMKEQIKSVREWAKPRARRASAAEWEEEEKSSRKLELE